LLQIEPVRVAVRFLTLMLATSACGDDSIALVQVEITDKERLGGTLPEELADFRFVLGETALLVQSIATDDVVDLLPIRRHVDVVRCYDGCGGCVPLDDSTRPWYERRFAVVDWSPAYSTGAIVTSGEFCDPD
jgi:hypothetical protein